MVHICKSLCTLMITTKVPFSSWSHLRVEGVKRWWWWWWWWLNAVKPFVFRLNGSLEWEPLVLSLSLIVQIQMQMNLGMKVKKQLGRQCSIRKKTMSSSMNIVPVAIVESYRTCVTPNIINGMIPLIDLLLTNLSSHYCSFLEMTTTWHVTRPVFGWADLGSCTVLGGILGGLIRS